MVRIFRNSGHQVSSFDFNRVDLIAWEGVAYGRLMISACWLDEEMIFPPDVIHDGFIHPVTGHSHGLAVDDSAKEITATSVVPPPMSTTIFPLGSVTGIPAPMAAAMGSSMKNTSLAPADSADSRTALFSTWVMPLNSDDDSGPYEPASFVHLPDEVAKHGFRDLEIGNDAFFHGSMATMFPGVRQASVCFLAHSQNLSALSFLSSFTATTEGSFRTMPLPFT